MKVTLVSGREIALVRLTQWRTYYGHLAGLPHKRINEQEIARDLEEARGLCALGGVPFLIEPAIQATGRTIRMLNVLEERLPAVGCAGVWDSGSPVHAGAESYSSAVVVWYQPDFGLAADDESRARFRTLDWERIAVDWSW